jgi:hypothetical protein
VRFIKARKQAAGCRRLVSAGIDPIEARKEKLEAFRLASAKFNDLRAMRQGVFIASH